MTPARVTPEGMRAHIELLAEVQNVQSRIGNSEQARRIQLAKNMLRAGADALESLTTQRQQVAALRARLDAIAAFTADPERWRFAKDKRTAIRKLIVSTDPCDNPGAPLK